MKTELSFLAPTSQYQHMLREHGIGAAHGDTPGPRAAGRFRGWGVQVVTNNGGGPGFGARRERWQAWEERSLGVKLNPKCRPDPETLSFWEQAVRSGP